MNKIERGRNHTSFKNSGIFWKAEPFGMSLQQLVKFRFNVPLGE
jgi:hypothetical protein